MNYSPFEIFRRNLKPMMVFLTLLALLAFVVLPTLQSYMQAREGGGGDAVVAKFAGGSLRRSRVDYFTRNHRSTVRFLAELAMEAINRGGVPATPGFQYDAQNKEIQRLGINESPSFEGTIRTFMLAGQAAESGFELDDASLSNWLESFTGGVFSDSEITARLMQSTSNQMGRPHLYEQLRNHLLADVYLRRGNAGLVSASGGIMTPDEQWRNFLKLNQNATVSTYGVLVSDYLDQTDRSPSEEQIREVFEAGKDRDPDPQSPEPGFHQPYAARFEYLVGDYQQFLDAEIEKLSEQAIQAEYQRRAAGGDFQLPPSQEEAETDSEPSMDLGDQPVPTDQPTDAASETDQPADAPIEDTSEEVDETAGPSTETAAESDAGEDDTTESDATQPEDPSQSGEQQSEDQAAETADSEDAEAGESETTQPDAATEESSSDASSDQPSGDDQSSHTAASNGTRLVVAQVSGPDDAAVDTETETETTEDRETGDSADAEQTDQTDDNDTETPADSPRSVQQKPAGTQPLEEVRDQIAEDLAGPAARGAMDRAVTEINQAMRTYFSELAIYQSDLSIGKQSKEPTRPDLRALASQWGMTFESIGPHDRNSIQKEPIARSFEVGSQLGRRGVAFPLLMFGLGDGRDEISPRPLFAALRTADDQQGKIYVSWKVDETQARTPTLDEVREDVIMAIRTKEARQLAKQAAEQIAAAATESGDLAAEVPTDQKSNYYDDLGPYTWMNSFGFQGATLGNVRELDSVGNEFMKATFTTETGQLAVAANQPESVFYVVKPTRFQPNQDELREQFKQPVNRMMSTVVSTGIDEVFGGFFQSISDQVGFESFVQPE